MSVGYIFLLTEGIIRFYVAELIVSGSLSTIPVFWMSLIYLIVTVHNIVFLSLETTVTTLMYLACFD